VAFKTKSSRLRKSSKSGSKDRKAKAVKPPISQRLAMKPPKASTRTGTETDFQTIPERDVKGKNSGNKYLDLHSQRSVASLPRLSFADILKNKEFHDFHQIMSNSGARQITTIENDQSLPSDRDEIIFKTLPDSRTHENTS
jgi:hypothetical protein